VTLGDDANQIRRTSVFEHESAGSRIERAVDGFRSVRGVHNNARVGIEAADRQDCPEAATSLQADNRHIRLSFGEALEGTFSGKGLRDDVDPGALT